MGPIGPPSPCMPMPGPPPPPGPDMPPPPPPAAGDREGAYGHAREPVNRAAAAGGGGCVVGAPRMGAEQAGVAQDS